MFVVVHRNSSKWPKKPAACEICEIFTEHPFYRTALVAASVAKIDQKKQKDILRKDTLQIFLLKHNDAKKQKQL